VKLPGVRWPKKGSKVQRNNQPGAVAVLAGAAPRRRSAVEVGWAASRGGLTLAGTPPRRLSPRTMLNVLLLCCGLLQGIQAILTADLGHLPKASGRLEGMDRARYSSLLRKVKEASAEPAGESCSPPSPVLPLPPTSCLLACPGPPK